MCKTRGFFGSARSDLLGVEADQCHERQEADDEDLRPVAAEDDVVLVRHQLGLTEVIAGI